MSDERRASAKRQEHGRRSPSHSLNEAIGLLGQVRQGLGEGPFGRESVAKALGHQAVTGASATKIGCLTHFRLLLREESVYRVSELGGRILFSTNSIDRARALAEAATAPALYGELVKAYEGKALPTLLPNILIQNYGIAPANASDVASCFRQSMEFAGLLRHGILYSKPPAATSDSEDPPDGASQIDDESSLSSEVSRVRSGPVDRSTGFSIPLTSGRVATLELPRPLAESDFRRIIGWLELMKDVLTGEEEGEA